MDLEKEIYEILKRYGEENVNLSSRQAIDQIVLEIMIAVHSHPVLDATSRSEYGNLSLNKFIRPNYYDNETDFQNE